MNKIVRKEQFSERVFLFEIEAPLIAMSRKAGNFVIVRVDKKGERMPLTIAGADIDKGTITLVVQMVGLSSKKLCALNEGDYVADVVGPLGNPTHIENYGTVVCAGGGLGVAPMLPIIQALKKAGNRVLSVMAGRSKDLIILENNVRASSDEVIIMTDDGSYGEKGVVTVGIEKFIEQEHVDKVFAIGPPIMMKFSNLTAQKHGIPCEVSLNTIMVDGTGMCGACRLTIGGKTRFVCIDGPEFDGALVDWDEMFKRMGTFKRAEQEELEHYEEHLSSVCGDSIATIKAFNIATIADLAATKPYEGLADYFLFDAKTALPGGSGSQFDWSILDAYDGDTPFLLSGGIGPEDAEALQSSLQWGGAGGGLLAQCVGIDLNSRFELAPALKDVAALRRFLFQMNCKS